MIIRSEKHSAAIAAYTSLKRIIDSGRLRLPALVLVLGVAAGALVMPSLSQAAGYEDLLTDHVVEIHETVSDAGFVHPGVGLSAENLRNAQEMVRSGREPWASYFDAMAQVRPWAAPGYTVDNMRRGQPDVVLDPNFNHGGLRGRLTRDSFGVLTQALLWVMTGDEVYRKGAIMGLRTWSNMNPDGYVYFPDAHIHTGKPLSQFLMAAEIIRATEPVDDGSPGSHEGYNVQWTAEDDEKLLGNLAEPIVNVFNFSNEKWMNQHNFGLCGRIATAIYADDAAGYAKGVEWFTMNSTFDDYINGALGVQIQQIAAADPVNPYSYEFTQVREMGRDQAHGETNIDNFAALARFLDVQGTRVDPLDGTLSTADDAVTAYRFLDNRLLEGADAFYGFMLGAWIPWVDERGEGWNGTVSQAYRGRIFNPLSELYYQYTYREGVDVEAEAPWLAELHARMDGPFFYRGTGVANFWAPGDKSVEYWVAFPEEMAGIEPTPAEATALNFGRYSLQLDDRTELVTEGGRTFARAHVDEQGTINVVSRIMYPGGSDMGVLVRSDGPATLEVLDKEPVSGLNEDEAEPWTMATIDLPDTGGEWRYVTYPARGQNTHFYRLTGASGTTVDLDVVILAANTVLTPPVFEQEHDLHYLWADAESVIDLSASDAGGSVSYRAIGFPNSASFDPGTGVLTWKPSAYDRGMHSVQVVADDGETVTVRTFEFMVAKNRPKMIDALLAVGVDQDAEYTSVSFGQVAAEYAEAKEASESGTDEEFRAAFEELRDAVESLELLNPRLTDGSLGYPSMVNATVLRDWQVEDLADGNNQSHGGDQRVGSFVIDFGTRYRVSAEEFGIQARFTFPMRSQGTNVYGSNDGITWVLLTERESSETNEMEAIPVVAGHRFEQLRYLKLQVDNPGIPIDPAYPGIWSIGEFHLFGDRSEVPGTITDVSLTSADALRERVVPGDTVELVFSSGSSGKPISNVAVMIAGREVEAVSEDGLAWTASTELGEGGVAGPIPISIDYTTENGDAAATVLGTTDFTGLYYSDEHNLVDLAGAAVVIDAAGAPDSAKAGHSAAMLDGNVGSASDVRDVDGDFYLIWDFGEGGTIELDRIDFLARQDNNNGMVRMDDLVFQGSNDFQNWTTLTGPTAKEHDWQNLDSLDESAYRYLRVRNGAIISIAEIRIFGEFRVEFEAALARAEAVDLDQYSRASGILFTREVEAVRAEAEEPGADLDALSKWLLAAWNLLEAPVIETNRVDRSWVAASTESWDGSRSAADNGWVLFDNDPATFTDTKQAQGWVRVLPTDGTVFTVSQVWVQPRAGHAHRARGFQLQGSNDGGATWATFATIGDVAAWGWTVIDLPEAVAYGALRVYSPNGYTNLSEVLFVRSLVDASGLDLYLSETEGLSADDWTTDSWANLVEAREAGLALRADGASPSQEDVDAAADALAAAVAALEPAA